MRYSHTHTMQYDSLNLPSGELVGSKREQKTRAQFEYIIRQLDTNLSYTHYTTKSGSSNISVNAHELQINGVIGGGEMEHLSRISELEDIFELRRKVSHGMARTAVRAGGEKSHDYEWDYPAFISPSERGEAYFMFRDSARTGMIISYREGVDDSLLRIESRDIQDRYEQKVLLGGVAAFLAALEIK